MLSTILEDISGRKLRISIQGSGEPLLFLHGYPDNLQIWSHLVPRLQNDFRCVAFDWPGMGYSEEWPGGATPEHLADRLQSIMNHLNIERAGLIAMDMGGQPALVFAAKYPSRIDRLIVMNCLAFGDERTSWEIRLLRRFAWNRRIIRNFPRLVFFRALRTFLPGNDRLADNVRKDFWNAFHQPDVRRYISKMCAAYQGKLDGLPEFYSQIQCPALVLWGEQDSHFPPVHAEKLQQVLQHSTLSILPGLYHWMVWHAPDRLAPEILKFLGRKQPL